MKSKYSYFKRDISWLSFNYRVLLEALDEQLPLYERINFISIYSSNLEEFYKIRVADHKAVASGVTQNDEETVQSARELVEEINREVTRQLDDRVFIYEQKILPALRRNHIIFYQDSHHIEDFHKSFIRDYFKEEIFPYLQPVPVAKNKIVSFLRDNRIYLAIRLYLKENGKDNEGHTTPTEGENNESACRKAHYFVMKQPYAKVPRFIELPSDGTNYYLMFIEDIIKANLPLIFPGYDIDSSYSIKISRDADILIDDDIDSASIVKQVKEKVKKRKIGAVCRFVYNRSMPEDFLDFLVDAFGIHCDELVPGDKHLNMEDLSRLPNPNRSLPRIEKPKPIKLNAFDEKGSIFRYVAKKDLLLYYPYHSFEHFIHFLYEAVHDPNTREIMVTQYRVAENSAVINTLIAAARNGKKVTVFVELKARFDEEHNLATAEMMQAAGIKIIYSLPGLKVHAKVALIRREGTHGEAVPSYAYVSTGNFNEKTATLYADCGLFTCHPEIVNDLHNLFRTLRGEKDLAFSTLLVTRFNLIPKLNRLIDREIALVKAGKTGRIILKMNALQDTTMIDRLYEASEAGVQIDLIVRGICCLIPEQPYSRNIRITRIVDSFLEHARIWYFGNEGNPLLFLGSPDWMRRNLYRRIEAVTPVLDDDLRNSLIEMLDIQLADNQKACWVDGQLRNIFKKRLSSQPAVRAQYTFAELLAQKARLPRKNTDTTDTVIQM
ncbi:RNA degradosome polyphosphate kinase [Bacteroides pyogenes]|uniref:RNA degradosome polyphosphate kinase n=1 Tax=Bacteroides pyogenes TaxID=310300 RepID=UPI0011E42861|nr:RNA degradosome polyphosphate kinase [Bacteroides pyogenes]MBR8709674.1 Polyphosphate kinase [Bacteroides pyogenes]MBR8718562.1 Polyphosphate kinase [Bacteroides pyogenes]MBR8748026.1 Polyphosphate kinase [Bacteroides pyogenes]MBR8758318.1 Polyphosphate kinase [Bacteroides pyogenes]MBR8781545.1 Polyphosphate kinase [Bacteroides pyogenes]